jgi:hypothetical protein
MDAVWMGNRESETGADEEVEKGESRDQSKNSSGP